MVFLQRLALNQGIVGYINNLLPLGQIISVMYLSVLLGSIGPWQVVLIVAIVLLLFGGRKIPELMRGLGKGIKEFKDASKGEENSNSSSPSKQENNQ